MATVKRTPNRVSVICLLFLSFVSSGCASNELKDVKLTMAWEPGEPMRHTHRFTMDTSILGNSVKWNYEGAFTRRISKHEEGLLISHSDFKLLRSDQVIGSWLLNKKRKSSRNKNNKRAIEISERQKLMAKLTVAALVIRPNYIISPSGDFIRFHEYEKYKSENEETVAKFVGWENGKYQKIYAPVVEAIASQDALKKAVKDDLDLWRKWNAMALSQGDPQAGNIRMLVSSNKNDVNNVDGKFSYVGSARCNCKTQDGCVSLKFSSERKQLYDVHLVVEQKSLTPHRYLITGYVVDDLSKQEDFKKNKKVFENLKIDELNPEARAELSYKIDVKKLSE